MFRTKAPGDPSKAIKVLNTCHVERFGTKEAFLSKIASGNAERPFRIIVNAVMVVGEGQVRVGNEGPALVVFNANIVGLTCTRKRKKFCEQADKFWIKLQQKFPYIESFVKKLISLEVLIDLHKNSYIN